MIIPSWKIAQIVGTTQERVDVAIVGLETAFAKYYPAWPQDESAQQSIMIAAVATIKVECPPFKPIHEYGTDEYFRLHYDITGNPHKAAQLGNDQPGDGIKYAGRGFIQLTGKSNYHKYGLLLGVDLVADPDLALRPDLAAAIFALYFKNAGCIVSAIAQDWNKVRLEVNGGYNGLDLFLSIISKLQEAAHASIC